MSTPLLLVQTPPKDDQYSEASGAITEAEIIALRVPFNFFYFHFDHPSG